MFCTYLYRDPKDGTPRYVGWGSSLERPFYHLKRTHNVQLGRMLKKRKSEGLNPRPEVVVCPIQTESYAKLLECCWIEKYGREDLGKGTLFNKTDGGDGVSPGTEPWNKGTRGAMPPAYNKGRTGGSCLTTRGKPKPMMSKLLWWKCPGKRSVRAETSPGPEWARGRGTT